MRATMLAWLARFLRSDSPESMTRALMAACGVSIAMVAATDCVLIAAVAYRVRYGLTASDPSPTLLGSATVIGALAAAAWGQARERTKTTPDGTAPQRPTGGIPVQKGDA